jgi:hypothetical protein
MQQLEIIKIKKNNNTVVLANYLNYFLSSIRIMHWYTLNLNLHEIFGELYKNINISFDSFQEEIIGLNRQDESLSLNLNNLINQNLDEIIENDTLIIETYKKIVDEFKKILSSQELNNYISNSNSGLNNSKEEILSQLNKSLYLISLVKL